MLNLLKKIKINVRREEENFRQNRKLGNIIKCKIISDKPIIKLSRKFPRENSEKILSLACSVDAYPPALVNKIL